MVSSSRKKNKGKERMAKKIEAERNTTRRLWWGLAIGGQYLIGMKTITCDHGCGELPNDLDHPVSSFMDDFISNWNNSTCLSSRMIISLFKKHPQIFNNESYRQLAMNILIRIGTNDILMKEELGTTNLRGALDIAKTIVVFEHYDSMSRGDDCNCSIYTAVNCRGAATKIRDLNSTISSNRRDGLKFFSKRVTCSCLKGMHQEARRTEPKIGMCSGCNRVKERVVLSVCSRCMVDQYCSRECQVANWPAHEKECDLHVQAHEEEIANRQI